MVTTAVDRWFIDTNTLIFANLPQHPLSGTAAGRLLALEAAGAELWLSRQVLREYLAGMTRPRTFTGTTPMGALVADVQRFQRTFTVADDTVTVTAHLLTLLQSIPATGLLTHNVADFNRIGGLITVVPPVP
jgi:hypothetical protein